MRVVRPEVEFNVGERRSEEQEWGRDRKFLSLSLFNTITRVRKKNIINVVWHHVEFA